MLCSLICYFCFFFFFFFNDTATTEIYTLSLHDALPISPQWRSLARTRTGDLTASVMEAEMVDSSPLRRRVPLLDRKSTRLNSSHGYISYAVFCLKKKKIKKTIAKLTKTYLIVCIRTDC